MKERRETMPRGIEIIEDQDAIWRRRRQIFITHRGKRLSVYDWSKEKGIRYNTLLARVHANWSPWEILETPVKTHTHDRDGRIIIRDEPRSSYESVPRKISATAHPVMQMIFTEMKRQGMTYEQMHRKSGVSYSAQQQYKLGHMGLFPNVEAMANAVGLKIVAVEAEDT